MIQRGADPVSVRVVPEKKIPPGRTAGRINRGQCHDRMKIFYHARKVPAMVESWLFRSRCSGFPSGKDQNRFRPSSCLLQDEKGSSRRAYGGRTEKGTVMAGNFFGK